MLKTKKINKIFICLITLFIGALAIVLPFALKSRENVFADEITPSGYSFVGSVLVLPMSRLGNGLLFADTVNNINVLPRVEFGGENGQCKYIKFYFRRGFSGVEYLVFDGKTEDASLHSFEIGFPLVYSDNDFNYSYQYTYEFSNFENGYGVMDAPIGLKIYQVFESEDPYALSQQALYSYFQYFDDKGHYLEFSVKAYFANSNFALEPRTYYFSNTELPDNYEEGYNAGLIEGSASGYNDGYTSGYTDGNNYGYNLGISEGYNDGYNVGIIEGGEYSFLGLIGAVVDAPIKAFTGLFNFEILGVNLSGFLLGLLTLAIVLAVIKLIKRG